MYKADSSSGVVPVVAVIGGGASGALTAVHVLWEAVLRSLPLSIALIDQQGTGARNQSGPLSQPDLLSLSAEAVSAFSDDPGHLVRWAADKQIGDGFLPRASYGDYLSEVLAGLQRRAAARARVARLDSQVVAIRRDCGRRALRLDLAAEGRIDADVVILATGSQATDLEGARPGLGAAWPAGATATGATIDGADDPLLRRLLDSGLVRPGRLGLGLDADAHGALVDSAGHVSVAIYAVGPLVGGTSGEASGIPGIRDQAEALARHLASRLAVAGPRSAA